MKKKIRRYKITYHDNKSEYVKAYDISWHNGTYMLCIPSHNGLTELKVLSCCEIKSISLV